MQGNNGWEETETETEREREGGRMPALHQEYMRLGQAD
jgi:hypothetical protein